MRLPNVTIGTVVASACAVVSLGAADGVLVVQRVTADKETRTTEVQIEAQRMRVEMSDPLSGAQVMIFDGTKPVMFIVSPAKKSYSEMTKADVERAGAQLSGALAQMQEMLKSMPPEQRAQMEAMMKKQGMPGMGAAPARIQYRKTGTSKVGKWTCDTYDGTQNGKKVAEVCTVSPQAFGLRPDDFAVTAQMAEFFSALMPQGTEGLLRLGKPEADGFAGIPVRHSSTVGGRTTVMEVVEVSRRSFNGAVFAVPAGFRKEASPFAGRR